MNGDDGLNHGEISARLAQENGYNVIRLLLESGRSQNDVRDFSIPLKQVDQAIDSGQLNLGKVDVLNLSFGQKPDPTFADVSNWLKMEISPENLKENRDKID